MTKMTNDQRVKSRSSKVEVSPRCNGKGYMRFYNDVKPKRQQGVGWLYKSCA